MLQNGQRGTVVLIHGLWMGPWIMGLLERRLGSLGYRCERFAFASLRGNWEVEVERLTALARGIAVGPVHYVGHSLGGLLARFAA